MIGLLSLTTHMISIQHYLVQDTVDRDGMQERTGGSDWQLTKDLS